MKKLLFLLLLLAPTAQAQPSGEAELDSLRGNLRQRLAHTRRLPDDALANACADLAEYWCYRSNDSSRYYADKGLEANGDRRDTTALRLLIDLGVTYFNSGEMPEADRLFREAVLVGERLAFDEGLIVAYSSLGVTLRRQDRNDEALEYYKKGLECAERNNDDSSAANLYGNIAVLYGTLNRFAETLEYAEKGVAAAERCEDYEQAVYTGTVKASALIHLGRLDEGIDVLRSNYHLALRLGSPKLALKCISPLLSGFDRQERRDSVEHYLTIGKKLLPQVSAQSIESMGFLEMQSNLLSKYGHYAESLAIRRRMLAMQRQNAQIPAPKLLRAIAGDYAGQRRYKEAYDAVTESCRIQDSITANGIQQQLSDLTVKYRTQEKELEITRLETEQLIQQAAMMRKTIWFIALSLVLGLILLFVWLRYRRSQRRAHVLEEEQQRQKREFDILQKQVDLRLACNYIDGLEAERSRLAKELHDGICNDLFGLELHLGETLADDKSRTRTLTLLRRMREEVRGMSHTLMPPRFQYASIDEVLAEFAVRLSETHRAQVDYTSTTGVAWSALPDKVGYELYRIVQEVVNNAVKHASAQHIDISLTDDGREYRLTIRDDGRGMPPSHHGDGIGTQTVADRARSIGSRLEIETGTSGTTVTVRIRH